MLLQLFEALREDQDLEDLLLAASAGVLLKSQDAPETQAPIFSMGTKLPFVR